MKTREWGKGETLNHQLVQKCALALEELADLSFGGNASESSQGWGQAPRGLAGFAPRGALLPLQPRLLVWLSAKELFQEEE